MRGNNHDQLFSDVVTWRNQRRLCEFYNDERTVKRRDDADFSTEDITLRVAEERALIHERAATLQRRSKLDV